ncbi:MAG: hypothetical protein LBC69_01240 [Eubacteriaceae bacterium]|jgi:16S rRNA (cytosine967-C5)-methyltransferase|nr:hypothetical protein [Eubacteriaceae bacterium]
MEKKGPESAQKKISPSRLAAYKALSEVLFHDGLSNAAITRHTAQLTYESDAKLAAQIVYGTIKKLNKLEKIVGSLSNARSAADPRAILAVEMGAYQLLYLDRIPDYAVVNDSVNIVKGYVSQSLAPYANGLLRNVARQKAALREPEKNFESRMLYDYGFGPHALKAIRSVMGDAEAEACARRFQELPTLYIRVNTQKTTQGQLIRSLAEEGIAAEGTYVPGGLRVEEAKNLFRTEMFRRGDFFVEDLSGQISSYALAPQKRDAVIDVCAAPGAKSFGAYLVSGGAQIKSADANPKRLDMLYRSAKQLGIPVKTLRRDATKDCPEEGMYDKAICDVPCSGLGVASRKPEALRSFTPEKQRSLAALQASVLSQAFRYLKKGGRLLYSTCTLAKAENEDICQALVDSEKSARMAPISLPFALKGKHPETESGKLLLSPSQDGCDGFFMCLIEKA